MKLPQTMSLGVQSLGRGDVNAPAVVANAKNQAQREWNKAINTAANTFGEIAMAENLADANLALSEQVAADKKAFAETQAYLDNTTSIDLRDKTIPEHVRVAAENYAEMRGITSGIIPTSEVVVDANSILFDKTRDTSFSRFTEFGQNEELQAKYNNAMSTVWSNSASAAVKLQTIQRLENLRARTDLRVDAAMNSLNEVAATQAIVEAEMNGIYTPDKAAEKLATVGPTIDYLKVDGLIRDANDQNTLDYASQLILSTRVSPDKKILLRNLLHQRSEQLHTQSTRAMDSTYREGMRMLVDNQLNAAWISEKLRNHQLSAPAANTLRTAMNTPNPRVSDPGAVDSMKTRIVAMLRPDPDGIQSIPERADHLRNVLISMASGVTTTGEIVEKTITGSDMLELMDLISKQENAALGKGSVVSSFAEKLIRASTGYSDKFEEAFGNNNATALAYLDFKSAIMDLMSVEGYDADIRGFIEKNATYYNAERYLGDLKAGLRDIVPASWQADIEAMTTNDDLKWVLYRARGELMKGEISPRMFQQIKRRISLNMAAQAADGTVSDYGSPIRNTGEIGD